MTDLGMAAKLQAAFEVSPTILAVTDLPDGRIVEVNDAFLRALGYAREEIIGRPISRASSPLTSGPAADRARRSAGRSSVPRRVRGRTEHALRRRIVRDRRSVLEAVPVRVAGGRIVPVVVALADRRDRPPGIVDVADLPARDVAVRHGEIHESEEARRIVSIEFTSGPHRPSDRVPVPGALKPEPRDLRLGGGADRAHLSSHTLDLIESRA